MLLLMTDFLMRSTLEINFMSPIFVNDDVVDVIINPGKVKEKSLVDWRPKSDAFSVVNELVTVQPNKNIPWNSNLSCLSVSENPIVLA